MTVTIYIYLYIEKFEFAWLLLVYIYILIYGRVWGCMIFVEEPPPYLQQVGRNMTVIIYIYTWLIPCQRKQEKTLTSPILLKTTEYVHMAVNRWHTKFETDRITFRGHLRVFLSGGWKAFFSKPLLRNFTSHSIIHCTHSFVDRKIPKLPPESSNSLLF